LAESAPAHRRSPDLLIAALLALGLFVVNQAMFASAYGLTYDEPVYAAVAQRHLHWLGRVLSGDGGAWSPTGMERGWGNSGPTPVEADWHPPLGKVWEGLWAKLPSPFGGFAPLRAGATALFALTAAALYLWLTAAAGRVAGLAAALVYATLPLAVAHGNLAALDGPCAAVSTFALWQGWRLLRSPSWRQSLGFGLLLGAAMATKFNGLMVAPAVLLLALWQARPALKPLALAGLVALATFWAVWPWLWYDGFEHLRQVIAFHGKHGLIATQYFGTIYTDPPPPWHYPFVMLAITTPLPVLLAAAAGAAPRGDQRRLLRGLLLAALACHVLPFASPSAAKYNGVRLFLPALPLLAALAGLGLSGLSAWLSRRLKLEPEARWRPAAGLLAVVCLPGLIGLLEVHPYPMAYYNVLVGGAAGAERRGLEVAFWGDSFRGLCGWLTEHAESGARVYLNPPGAIAMVEGYKAVGILRPDLKLVYGVPAEADYFVYQNRPSEWDKLGFELSRGRRPVCELFGGGARVGMIWAARP
jgi:hypothetical protein